MAEDEIEKPIEERLPAQGKARLKSPSRGHHKSEAEEPRETSASREAKNVRFSDWHLRTYQGFDPTTQPDTRIVPVGEANARANAKVRPAGAVPYLEMEIPSVTFFSLNSGLLKVTGLAIRSTNLRMLKDGEVKPKLSILVPPSSTSYTVDYIYVHQTAGVVAGQKRPRQAQPPRNHLQTARDSPTNSQA